MSRKFPSHPTCSGFWTDSRLPRAGVTREHIPATTHGEDMLDEAVQYAAQMRERGDAGDSDSDSSDGEE